MGRRVTGDLTYRRLVRPKGYEYKLQEPSRYYCKECGEELRGKTITVDGWNYHLKCWREKCRSV